MTNKVTANVEIRFNIDLNPDMMLSVLFRQAEARNANLASMLGEVNATLYGIGGAAELPAEPPPEVPASAAPPPVVVEASPGMVAVIRELAEGRGDPAPEVAKIIEEHDRRASAKKPAPAKAAAKAANGTAAAAPAPAPEAAPAAPPPVPLEADLRALLSRASTKHPQGIAGVIEMMERTGGKKRLVECPVETWADIWSAAEAILVAP